MSQSEWITYLTTPQRAVFLDSLQASLSARGLEVVVEDGVVVMGEAAVDLVSLASACAKVDDASKYRTILDAHIDDLLLSFRDSAVSSTLDADWEKARAHVKLRLFPAEQAAENAEILISAHIGADLAAVLVYDLPESVASVQPDAIVDWSVTGQELWRIALDNLRGEDPPPDVERIALTEQADALHVSGESFFITSRLLILGDILPSSSFPYGALVILPHRHAMIVHPITGAEIYDALAAMSLMADEMFTDSPGPMSSEVYWWRNNSIETVEMTIDEEKAEVTVLPSEEFAELLDWLLRDEE